ncbi:nucleoside ABC transporter membrane protein [Arboricoccus pini]|uniref:Nucleoside ABC transporter membrane protein n=1 Tax=Arboricoccus pini TaxID=1963835 RepID=A0A212QC68_9PROT|nr:ABC transporter permease [Arboricoccus pini]SNB56913.1 nucleoside ABC transporter membrane protein [Arboricoccus pini]
MRLRLEPRPRPSRLWLWGSPILAILLTVLTGAVLFAAIGRDPLASLEAYFISPLATTYGLAELALKGTPLALIAVGLSFGFRANVWNIGAEGQFTMGAIAAAGVALQFAGSEATFELPLMLLAAILAGMGWAALPAFLRARLEVSEILVSLMLTYVATLFLSFLVYGPWKDPAGFNFPQTIMFDQSAAVPVILANTRLNLGVVLALLIVAVAWLVQRQSLLGFQLRVMGLAPLAARYAGFGRARLIWISLLLSGGLAGLAGALEVAGPLGQLVPVISQGYGFTAITVAFLGRLHPFGILLASLALALSVIGGENAQIAVGVPRAATGVFQGLLLFYLLGADILVRYRLRRLAEPGSLGAARQRATTETA